tara:strand:+ start:204 stop:596 length:393 start_codon:yes stop_codon:yes gene_type:complete
MPINTLIPRKKKVKPLPPQPAKLKGSTKGLRLFKKGDTKFVKKTSVSNPNLKAKKNKKALADRSDYVGGTSTGKADKGKRLQDVVKKYESMASKGKSKHTASTKKTSKLTLTFKHHKGKMTVKCGNLSAK